MPRSGRIFLMKEMQTMTKLDDLLANNRQWSAEIEKSDPGFFQRLAKQQSPQFLWIGCSDSRVPAAQVTGTAPGELFVHRNIANQVDESDLNCHSVMQYAVEALKVRHIVVCGHTGCGGVKAAYENQKLGRMDAWLGGIRELAGRHAQELDRLDESVRVDRLCELNVVNQVDNVCATKVVRDAWGRGQALTVHGLIYGLEDGSLRDLDVHISNAAEADQLSNGMLSGE